MFFHLSVSHSVHRLRGCIPAFKEHGVVHRPGRKPLTRSDIPPDRHPPGRHPLGQTSPETALTRAFLLVTRPKRSFGQGNVFTGICDSVHRGGQGLQTFGGGLPPNFRGGSSKFFLGGFPPNLGVPPNFRGGFLQIFGGEVPPNFRGGCLHQNTVNVRPVRILLECILVFNYCFPLLK